jgi:hypothetical protein
MAAAIGLSRAIKSPIASKSRKAGRAQATLTVGAAARLNIRAVHRAITA